MDRELPKDSRPIKKIVLAMAKTNDSQKDQGYEIIFRMTITLPDGRVIRSKSGKPFPIKVKK